MIRPLTDVPIVAGMVMATHLNDGFTIDDLARLLTRPAWHADAACKEHPEVDFFPPRGEPLEPARAVCATCMVRDECRAAAVDEKFGVWGGQSERERRRQRGTVIAARKAARKAEREARRAAQAAADEARRARRAAVTRPTLENVEHGLRGWRKGCGCPTCTAANRAYQREWSQARRRSAA